MADPVVDASLITGDSTDTAAAGNQDAPVALLDAEGKPVVGADGKPTNLDKGQKQELKEGKPVYDKDGKPVFVKADANAVPEKYEFKAPEGMELNEASVAAFSAFAKDAKLSQESAQKVVDMGIGLMQSWQDQQTEAFKNQRAEWVTNSKADKEFGGDKLAENLGAGLKTLEKFGTPDFIKFVNQSGIGDHPEFIRFVHRVAQATKEDNLPADSRTAGGGKDTGGAFNYGASKHA